MYVLVFAENWKFQIIIEMCLKSNPTLCYMKSEIKIDPRCQGMHKYLQCKRSVSTKRALNAESSNVTNRLLQSTDRRCILSTLQATLYICGFKPLHNKHVLNQSRLITILCGWAHAYSFKKLAS